MKSQLTDKEYEILTKDLSARAFYGCYVHFPKSEMLGKLEDPIQKLDISNLRRICINLQMVVIKPYLRPMSSMTEEEQKEYDVFCCEPYLGIDETTASNFIDWLNTHHFDYRGLIEMGLAIEAPEGMYN